MGGAGSYRQGRIVFAYLRSNTTGKRQRHPAIVLDLTPDIIQPEYFDPRKTPRQNIIHVIGVSTKYKVYNVNSVSIPFAASGHVATKMRADCGAIIGWYQQLVIPDDVIGFGGDVPAATMLEINKAVRKDLAGKIGGELDTLQKMFDALFGEEMA